MNVNKRTTLIPFISAAALLGLFNLNNSHKVYADTVNSPATTQVNNQAQTTTGNQNGNANNIAATQQTTNDQVDNQTTNDTSNADDSSSTNNQSTNKINTTYQNQYNLSLQAVDALQQAEIDPDSLTQEQVSDIKKIDFNSDDADSSTKWTYDQYAGVAEKMIDQDERYRVPYFNAKKIKNMPATKTRDAQTGKVAKLEVWDSWPVQNAKTAKVYNYRGYQLAIAMMGIPKRNDAHIYLLYNKYNDNNLKHWKCAGPIFGFKATRKDQEWSGSATVNKDGSIQLFYTDVDTRKKTNHQKISTANLKLKINKKKNKITIAKIKNRHVLFTGDGKQYQTYAQWKKTNKGADNIAMRDAHVIEVDGSRYLVFEASTGKNNYQSAKQIYNWKNYGGTPAEAITNFLKITGDSDMTSRASWANAAIGIVRLSRNENNPKVASVLAPLVNSLMVSDEIERPSIVPMNGKYYLFATTRLNRGTGDDLWKQANNEVGDNVAMLGWVSDHLTYGYEPLNGDAAVLVASVPFHWRTSTYSYYAVPVKGSENEVLITSYMTNRGFAAGRGKRSTWAPSFLVKVNGDTTEVEQVATNQGDWVYDEKSKRNSMIVSDISDAHLAGEPIKHSQLANA